MITTITSFFTDQGIPKTGLIPLLTARDTADNSIVVSNAPCVEVGGGVYKYDLTTDANEFYGIVVDGTAVLSDAERYQYSELPASIVPGRIC